MNQPNQPANNATKQLAPGAGHHLPPPPPTASRFVRALVGFGVSAVLGLAPLLGTVQIPGFTALLALFPRWPSDMAKPIIPIASFLMGTLSAIVAFYATERIPVATMRRWFKNAIVIVFAALLALLVTYIFSVVPLTFQGAKSVAVLVGFYRPASCLDCAAAMSDAECLEHTTLKPGKIRSCWGDRNINVAYLSLSVLYLVVMGGFGVLVGLYVLNPQVERLTPESQSKGA